MNLKIIVFRNLLRRKGKAAFVLAGLVLGVSTVVGIISYIEAMTNDINHKLEKYGANILIVPKTENLNLTYGGISLGGVSFEMEEIREKDLERIQTIKNANNIAALGPLVLGVASVNSELPTPTDWPTFRHDGTRSGATDAEFPSNPSPRWAARLGGKLSPPVVASGRVYVAAVDRHTVYSLDSDTGAIRWQYTAGARVDGRCD